MVKKEVFLKQDQEFMTLNVLLKITDIIPSGGMAKIYLAQTPVLVNGENENRRGRKLYDGDVVVAENTTFVIKKHGC